MCTLYNCPVDHRNTEQERKGLKMRTSAREKSNVNVNREEKPIRLLSPLWIRPILNSVFIMVALFTGFCKAYRCFKMFTLAEKRSMPLHFAHES